MATDLVLAILHHVLAFGLVAMLMAEMVLVRPGMSGADAERVSRLDAGFGATAGLLVVIGVLRVIYGLKGYAYYLENLWFWAKMASFLIVALLSIDPTRRFLRWRRLRGADAAFVPEAGEIARVRRVIRIEGLIVVLILVFAATMARYQ